MRSRDLVMIVVSFLAMLAGSFLPGLAEPLAPFPRLCLIVLLYLGFLSVGTEALFTHTRLIPGTVSGLVLIRLFALPLLSFFLFKLLMPQFALGALLVGAASIGVVAPIFSIMVNADTALVLAGNLLSSLLLPLTLPMLLYIVDSFMTLSGFGPMNLPAHLSLSGMTLSLCVTIIVPFAGAFLTRKAPRVTEYILKHQFPVSVSTIALSTLAIFSNYSGVLHQSPSLVVKALGAACLLGAVMMVGRALSAAVHAPAAQARLSDQLRNHEQRAHAYRQPRIFLSLRIHHGRHVFAPPERPPRLLSRLEPFMGAGAGCRITGLPPFFLPSTKSRGILYATFNYPLHFLMRPFMKNIPLLSRAPRFSHMLLAVLASVVFGGCSPSQKAAPQPEPTVPLTGMVTYRERMALPPDAELTVTLHRKTSDGRMLVAEERASTEGRNVPLPFSIACPAADSSSMSYELEAAISSGGTTLFATTRPLMVHPGDADIMVLTHRVMDTAPVTDGLAGTRWKLVELNGKPAEVYDNQPEPHLLFNPEGAQGRISGSDGCNSLIGSYTLQGDRIGFSQLGSTMMLCPKGDAQARALAQALAGATSVSHSGDTLDLWSGKTRVARFKATAL